MISIRYAFRQPRYSPSRLLSHPRFPKLRYRATARVWLHREMRLRVARMAGMTLTPERWRQVREVLHAAMQVDEGDSSAFLDSQCASDPSLRDELNDLLAAEGQIGLRSMVLA